ncbi:MAG: hypothetical protein Q9227_005452 [Pyrenula ochraceoflavens]
MATTENPTRDAIDHLFDESDGDLFEGLDSDVEKRRTESRKRRASSEKENNDLGIDEEVKITKKRKPIAKLDNERLLSEKGISKLRSSYKSKLAGRWKGKGHEFDNAAKLLNFYQLWLDALYPKANFADGLAMIEKVGHNKRMQIERKTWIDEGKPKPDYILDNEPSNETPSANTLNRAREASPDDDANALFVSDPQQNRNVSNDVPEDDDELDALLATQSGAPAAKPSESKAPETVDDDEGEDDLDALLAEYDSRKKQHDDPTQKSSENDDADQDDLDALLAEQDVSQQPQQDSTPNNDPARVRNDSPDAVLPDYSAQDEETSKSKRTSGEDELADQDELDALFAEHENQRQNE